MTLILNKILYHTDVIMRDLLNWYERRLKWWWNEVLVPLYESIFSLRKALHIYIELAIDQTLWCHGNCTIVASSHNYCTISFNDYGFMDTPCSLIHTFLKLREQSYGSVLSMMVPVPWYPWSRINFNNVNPTKECKMYMNESLHSYQFIIHLY